MPRLPKIIRQFDYDLTPTTVDAILRHKGIQLLVGHYAHRIKTIEDNPDLATYYSWDYSRLYEEMRRQGMSDPTTYQLALFEIRQLIESAPTGMRSKFNLATQISRNLSEVSENVSVVNLRGRTSRFDDRETSDLDLGVYFDRHPRKREVNLLLAVARDAMKKTGIGIDLINPVIPPNRGSFEHIFENYGQLYVGYPVYWREERFLEQMLRAKNMHHDEQIELAKRTMEKMKEMGISPPMVI